jgi:GT2 family glycosyltransferase
MTKVGEVGFALSSSSLVYDARNTLAKQAVDGGFDRVLWLDSDMDFKPDMFVNLMQDMDDNNLEIVGGIYFSRKEPVVPVVYQKVGYYHDDEQDTVTPCALNYYEYPKDELFPCEGIGFGAVLMTTDLIKKVQDKYGLPFSPILGFGEDLSFCIRARDVGATIMCDSRIKVGHVGLRTYTEEHYAR